MGHHIRWQAILTVTGIAMTLAFITFLAQSRTTVTLPDVGGTYTEAIAGVPQFINPLLAHYNQVDQDLVALVFNGLTRFSSDGSVEPDLAQSWTVSDDGLAYVFKLRRNLRWQDGRPFTSNDVVFTIKLMQDPDFPGVPYLAALWQSVTVEQLDTYSVRFTLAEPFPSFLDFSTIGLLPAHLLQGVTAGELLNHPFNLKPVGTGPFKLDEVNANFARLSVNPFYTGVKPRLTNIQLRFYPSYQQTIAAYQAGEVQGISYIPPESIPAVENLSSLNLYSARMSSYDIVYLNLQDEEMSPFFQDVRIRQALLAALNRQAIIDKALSGQGLVATGPIRSWSWAYNAAQPVIDYDPALANSLLDEAGWFDSNNDGIRDKDGRALGFIMLVGDEPNRVEIAKVISQMWRQIGVSASLDVVGAGLGERLAQRNFQAALAEVLLSGDPDPYPLWHQTQIEGGQNYAGWDDDKASMLLEEARTVTDRGRRNDSYFEFQNIFAEEVPSLILFHPVYTYGVSQEVNEIQLAPMSNPSERFRTLPYWYMLTRQVIYSDS